MVDILLVSSVTDHWIIMESGADLLVLFSLTVQLESAQVSCDGQDQLPALWTEAFTEINMFGFMAAKNSHAKGSNTFRLSAHLPLPEYSSHPTERKQNVDAFSFLSAEPIFSFSSFISCSSSAIKAEERCCSASRAWRIPCRSVIRCDSCACTSAMLMSYTSETFFSSSSDTFALGASSSSIASPAPSSSPSTNSTSCCREECSTRSRRPTPAWPQFDCQPFQILCTRSTWCEIKTCSGSYSMTETLQKLSFVYSLTLTLCSN